MSADTSAVKNSQVWLHIKMAGIFFWWTAYVKNQSSRAPTKTYSCNLQSEYMNIKSSSQSVLTIVINKGSKVRIIHNIKKIYCITAFLLIVCLTDASKYKLTPVKKL